MRAIRWSDNDRYFGPFTYSKNRKGDRTVAIILGSGDEEYPGCRLRLTGFGHTFIVALPPILKPYRQKVEAKYWSEAQIQRMGRNWYWMLDEREIGFSYSDGGFLQVKYGRQSDDSDSDKTWSKFLPWTQWRFVRFSLYGLSGEHYWTQPERRKGLKYDYEAERTIHDACPYRAFVFADFDGETLTARTRIEEREWHFGEGSFKWLSHFCRPKIRRSLDIDFSAETGRKKGSWKGGTLGHGIDMHPGETHEAAFRRYCDEHEMRFLGPAESREAVAS